MLGMVLKLLRPSYALTALFLFGGWQGYSFVKSIPEKLPLLPGSAQVQRDTEGQSEAVEAERAKLEQTPPSPTIAAIQQIHPGLRIVYWVVSYVLLCFASVPLIKRALAHESNLVNGILIVSYSGLGLLAAFVFAAFQFAWFTVIMLISALIFSAIMIIWLAGELEKIRVEDNLA